VPKADPSERAWRAVVAAQPPRRKIAVVEKFGSENLRIDGTVFAIHFKGSLVVKLPAERVAELRRTGVGGPFILGKREMKEWVAIAPSASRRWRALADEAREFVSR